jgi:GTPase SAR1 family protein
MPANLTPEYRAAEAAFRKARDPRERLEWLREMLRVIPKHKGTDHLQADIKRRIKELSEELEGPRKGGARTGPALVVRPEGAAQIALLGPPNSGKSSLHARLTGSEAEVGPYPFTTQYPQPGMLPHEDVYFQLVDLPAVSPEHPVSWLAAALQTADACLLVVDLSDPACVEQVEALHAWLRDKRVTLTEQWDADGPPAAEEEDPFALRLPALLLANQADRLADPEEELRAFLELTGLRYPSLIVSAQSGRHRARLHQGARQAGGAQPPLHPAPGPDGGGRGAAGAQGLGARPTLRPGMGKGGHPRAAGGAGTPPGGWGRGGAAHLEGPTLPSA